MLMVEKVGLPARPNMMRPLPVPVAPVLMVKEVEVTTAVTTASTVTFAPVRTMPGARPTVESQVMVRLLNVVAQLVSCTLVVFFATSVCNVAVPVAAGEMVKVVPLGSTEVTAVLGWMLGPEIVMPTERPSVLVQVTVVLALVVAQFSSVRPERRYAAPPVSRKIIGPLKVLLPVRLKLPES